MSKSRKHPANCNARPTDDKRQASWPRTDDVRAWMEAMLAAAAEIEKVERRVSSVCLATRELARMGHLDDALAHIERFLEALPPDDGSARSSLLDSAANMAIDADRLDVAEEFLKRMLDLQPLFPRKCDRGCQAKHVRDLRIRHGLLDPAHADNPQDRPQAAFSWHMRKVEEAIGTGESQRAIAELRSAEQQIPDLPDWAERWAKRDLTLAVHAAGDREWLQALLREHDDADLKHALMPHMLLKMGERDRAIVRYEREASDSLGKLRTETLNVHFPAMTLGQAIGGLSDLGEADKACHWLSRALDEGRGWTFAVHGAFSAAVFLALARATAKVEGVDAARKLLTLANDEVKAEKGRWRAGTVQQTVEMLEEIGLDDEALVEARRERSPRLRRQLLIRILARRADSEAVHTVLAQAANPEELADLIWTMKFVWRPAPGA